MNLLKVAQIQMPVFAEKRKSLAYVEEALARAAAEKADFAALPEMFCCPYHTDLFSVYAEEEGGQIWQTCSSLAAKYHLYLSAGTMPERTPDGKIYNTAFVFDREGRQIARHRKMHLFDIAVRDGQQFQESAVLTAGNTVTTFETEFGIFGLAVCYDIRFPELFRLMALKGARACLVPASFNMTTGPLHWELLYRSQAMYHQMFLIGTAPARDPASSYVSWGHSILTDPWGMVLSQMEEKADTKLTQIDLAEADAVREQIPVLEHLRTDVYTVRESGTAAETALPSEITGIAP